MTDIKQLSDLLNTPRTTINSWVKEFDIEARQEGKKKRFDDDAVKVLETIKNLRDQDNGFMTIKKLLDDSHISVSQNEQSFDRQVIDIEHIIDRSIEKHQSLAEKFAAAAHQVGRLEAENEHLKSQLKALPSPGDYSSTQTKLETVESEKEKLEDKLKAIESSFWYRLGALFKKPIW